MSDLRGGQKFFSTDQQGRLDHQQNNQLAATKKCAPLTGWQEYAHALLQANELSFVN